MMSVLTVVRRTAALTLCAAAALAVPLGASPAAADAPGAVLYVTVTPVNGGGAYSMRLTCDPDGGVHPNPGAACAELHEVEGVIGDLNADPGPCPLIHDPVDVEVHGSWYGRSTRFEERYTNDCVMERKLGPLVK